MKRLLPLLLLVAGCAPDYDVVIRGGTVYDGSGAAPSVMDIGVRGDSIAVLGDLAGATAAREIDAQGLAVAPGFINVLSWAAGALEKDGRGLSDIAQGITLEVFGEGSSGGPVSESMRAASEHPERITWRTFGGWLQELADRGISPNVASFVGATTVRIHEIGYEDRPPTPEELERMKALVRESMEEGALGIGTSLIYPPAFFASTDELIELSSVVAEYDGLYVSHMRSEGDRLLEALDELIRIARDADVRAEVYHLKAAGRENWPKLDTAIARIDSARAAGLSVSANMYTYTAGSTGLSAGLPPWAQEGGFGAFRRRLMDPRLRARIAREMTEPADGWENLLRAAGAEGTLLVDFRQDSLKQLIGRSLADVAGERGLSWQETAMDLIVQDSSRVGAVFFLMSEENVRRQVALPWMSFGSDAQAMAPEPPFTDDGTHPRAYGNVARLLGKYVRAEGVISLQEAVRRLTSLPAENLRIDRRGLVREGHFADLVVFDPDAVQDLATYERPHQLAEGVRDVLVNGEAVLLDGAHTGALPGRFVRRGSAR